MDKKKIFLICSIFIVIKEALAYIDPGTTGMIIGGSIWPFIVALFTAIGGIFLKIFWNPIKKGVLSTWKRKKD